MLTLRPRQTLRVPVDLSPLTPQACRDQSTACLERLLVYQGNRQVPLVELFALSGDPGDETLELDGDFSDVNRVGAAMTGGRIIVNGSAGDELGAEMSGGQIEVRGDCGDLCGAEMHDGRIVVQGSAGDSLGAAYAGSGRGMTGGEIFVRGDVGHQAGQRMRRGLIAIGGEAGQSLGKDMLAGTILCFGGCGEGVGFQMRRGTIALYGPADRLPPDFPPLTFRRGATVRPTILRMLLAYLEDVGVGFDDISQSLDAAVTIYHGDALQSSKGEIFVRSG